MALSPDTSLMESTTTTLDWHVTGLRKLFEGSKGEAKSKVVRSAKFAGGRWQILFYPNSGTDGGMHISLYLSCEPTTDEREAALNGKWVREGRYKFSFELKSSSGVLNSKEACDHSFSWKTANWGWAQFARRDSVYYSSTPTKAADAFTISCTITSSPAAPVAPPSYPQRTVPRGLMTTFGTLLNDPLYSDIEFILSSHKPTKTIYALKPILQSTEYFNTMLSTGFLEGNEGVNATIDGASRDEDIETIRPFNEDEDDDSDMDDDDFPSLSDLEDDIEPIAAVETNPSPQSPNEDEATNRNEPGRDGFETVSNSEEEGEEGEETNSESSGVWISRNSLPGSISQTELSLAPPTLRRSRVTSVPPLTPVGPLKTRITVNDVAYRTYYAMLYYIYTDSVVFAPLSSTFSQAKERALASDDKNGSIGKVDEQSKVHQSKAPIEKAELDGLTSRKEWLKEWRITHPGHVEPCSAKSMYKLADKLDLRELKERAFEYIAKSMTVENIPYEMFSSFSARFEEVKKSQVEFFLANWNEIRGSSIMRNIWQQIRTGRHPGFEEVWPQIAMNLEFNPTKALEDVVDNKGEGQEESR